MAQSDTPVARDAQDRPPLEEWRDACQAANDTRDFKRGGKPSLPPLQFADKARTGWPSTIAYALRLEQERDAALARAELAEAEVARLREVMLDIASGCPRPDDETWSARFRCTYMMGVANESLP